MILERHAYFVAGSSQLILFGSYFHNIIGYNNKVVVSAESNAIKWHHVIG